MLKDGVPLVLTVAEPMDAPSARKTMMPVGIEAAPVSVAVKVTEASAIDGSREDTTAMESCAGCTIRISGAEALALPMALPE